MLSRSYPYHLSNSWVQENTMRVNELSIFVIGAFLSCTRASLVDLFTDDNCQDLLYNMNVYDETCADWVDTFSSYRVTYDGGNGYKLTSYSSSDCDTYTACSSDKVTQQCINATSHWNGVPSQAIGSQLGQC